MPLIWNSSAFIIGTWLGSYLELRAEIWLGFGLVFLLLLIAISWSGIILRKRKLPTILKLILLVAISLSLGGYRYSSTRIDIHVNHAAWYNDSDESVYIEGTVYKFPDERDSYINIYVNVEKLGRTEYGMRPVEGKILLKVPRDLELNYGDKINFIGRLLTPDENEEFSYKNYLERKQVFSLVYYPYIFEVSPDNGNPIIAWLGDIRSMGISLIYQYLPDPEASLLTGIVLGYEKGIGEDVQKAFRDTGTTHVIAISGANISVIAGMMTIVFARMLGTRKGAVFALVGIVLYAILVGGDAVVVRAAIMGVIGLFAQQIGRRQHGVTSLLITAAVMVMVSPDVLWDVGFQLSLAAVMGLVLLSQPMTAWFTGIAEKLIHSDKVKIVSNFVGEYFLMTIAAQITTLPLIIYYFERLSLSSLPANAAILPAQPPIMLMGGLSVLAGLIWKPLGQLIAYFVWPFLTYTIRVVEWFADVFRNTTFINDLSFSSVIIFLVIVFVIVYWREKVFELAKRFRIGWAISFVLILNLFMWNGIFYAPDGKLHIQVFDVGSGNGVLIKTPDGRYVLINGGESSSNLSDGVGRRLPLFQQRIDSLIVANCAKEEIGGLVYAIEGFIP